LSTRTILVVDDDLGTLETASLIVRKLGFDAATASTGAEALHAARSVNPVLGLIDLRLPDMSGTDIIRALRATNARLPLILISGFLTIASAVEAMRLGATDVVEKPVSVDDLQMKIVEALDRPGGQARPAPADLPEWTDAEMAEAHRRARPTSSAERWARLVRRACQSAGDLRTLEQWAAFTGVSYSSLCETCRLLNIQPQNARDLARVLRALVRAPGGTWDVAPLLDVSDGRTLRGILHRAGLDGPLPSDMSIDRFFERQRFVDQGNEGLRRLRGLLSGVDPD
jgi:FixJ family two-component response regulator